MVKLGITPEINAVSTIMLGASMVLVLASGELVAQGDPLPAGPAFEKLLLDLADEHGAIFIEMNGPRNAMMDGGGIELPDEETHLATYRGLLAAMSPHPVVVRTLDLGGRKLGWPPG